MLSKQLKNKLLEIIHSKTGWGNPLEPYSEFEYLDRLKIKEESENKQILNFEYVFDEDNFSQYSKIHRLEGSAVIMNGDTITNVELEEVSTGMATNKPPYKP